MYIHATMFTIDAHLDLSMNAMEWNRDMRLPVAALREREKGMTDKPDRGRSTVSLPALRNGDIGLVVATQIAGLDVARAGLGANPGTTGLVQSDGSRKSNAPGG